MSQDVCITIRHSEFDGKFYLDQSRSAAKRFPLIALGNGFETREQAEQRKQDIESGAWKDTSRVVQIKFDPFASSKS